MICTAAVERTVHRHLIEQKAFLKQHDIELLDLVEQVQADEDSHLDHAEANYRAGTLQASIVHALVSAATEVLIFISTRGDSRRLQPAMAAA